MEKGVDFMGSVWQEREFCKAYPSVGGDLETEVLVIGGGMAGILCARLLQDAGKQVTVVEAKRIGSAVTARTTAVLTAQHDMLYQDMITKFGFDTAKAYLHANLDAVKTFRKMSQTTPCDFEEKPSIQFTTTSPTRMCKEAKTVQRLGFSAVYQSHAPVLEEAIGAVVYPGMALFHPLKFLAGAAKGLKIYENSRVLDLDGTVAQLKNGRIRAKKVIVATHFPFIDRRGLFFIKLYQNRSYVLALENAPDPGATMAELEGQGIYLRRWGDLLLLGGGDHRTGKKSGSLAFLRDYALIHFPRSREKFTWANQDCMSLDGLPYVGTYSPNMPNVYVATGFNAWGMTNSMVAAQVLTDMICDRKHPLEKALSPDRSVLRKQLFVNLGETVADFVIPTTKRCPHLGCALRWNPQEHSWDCPCHGSRFAHDGKLLNDPAQKDIEI
jgi:glycine/D-amino acid oxidase-like deaminating enzyme